MKFFYFVLVSLCIFNITILILIIRFIQTVKKQQKNWLLLKIVLKTLLMGEVDKLSHQNKYLIVFLHFTNSNNTSYLKNLINKYNDHLIIIVYQAPQWRMKALEKYINKNAIIINDEEGFYSKKLEIVNQPAYILLDNTFSIVGTDIAL